VLLMMGALLLVLFVAAVPSLRQFGDNFLWSTTWRPNVKTEAVIGTDGKPVRDTNHKIVRRQIPPEFGALPVIYGTAVSSAIALLFAVPLSLGAALFLVRICPKQFGSPVSFLIEFLAAIPSIAYGIWGVFVFGPFLARHVEGPMNSFSGRFPGCDGCTSMARRRVATCSPVD